MNKYIYTHTERLHRGDFIKHIYEWDEKKNSFEFGHKMGIEGIGNFYKGINLLVSKLELVSIFIH